VKQLGKAILKIMKALLFIIVAGVIGALPAFCCVWAGSFFLMLFGITVSETAGNVILVILALAIGSYWLADMLDIKFPSRRR